MGTVVLGTLSGFGAITTAWMFADALGKKRWSVPLYPNICYDLKGLNLSREGITKQDIASAEHSLTRVRNDLDLRNREAQALELQHTKNTVSLFYPDSYRGTKPPSLAIISDVDKLGPD